MRSPFYRIHSILLILIVLFSSHLAFGDAEKKEISGDGRVAIYNYHENEYQEIRYREGTKVLPQGLQQMFQALRSRDGTTHPIELRLIEILDHLQDHFHAETVEVISGFRSPSYNQSLRDNGRNAARESLHLKGMAADIHLDEVSEQRLFAYLKELGLGGAGIYPRYQFVHVDVGPQRTWGEPTPKERVLVGTENNPNDAWAAVTDANQYRPGSPLGVQITNNAYEKQRFVRNVWLERFRRGRWCEERNLEKGGKSVILKPRESTSFQWVIPEDQPLGKYRLLFFMSKDLSIPPVFYNEFFVRNE